MCDSSEWLDGKILYELKTNVICAFFLGLFKRDSLECWVEYLRASVLFDSGF